MELLVELEEGVAVNIRGGGVEDETK